MNPQALMVLFLTVAVVDAVLFAVAIVLFFRLHRQLKRQDALDPAEPDRVLQDPRVRR